MMRVNLKSIEISKVLNILSIKQGSNQNYHCPFHTDKTASMLAKSNRFYCFSCASKGNVIELLKRMLNITTSEAYNWLLKQFPNAVINPENNTNKYQLRLINNYSKQRYTFKSLNDSEIREPNEIDIKNIKKYLNKNYKLRTLSELGIRICIKPYSLVFTSDKFLIFESKSIKNIKNIKNTMYNKICIVFEGRTDYLSAVDSGLSDEFIIASRFNKTSNFTLDIADNYYFVLDKDDDPESLKSRINNFDDLKGKIFYVNCPNSYKDYSDYYNSPDFNLDNFKDYLINNSQKLNDVKISYITWANYDNSFTGIEWYWEGWIPKGFVTFIAGESGTGKSFFTLNLVKIFTQGGNFLDGSPFLEKYSHILWIENENSENLNVSRAKDLEIDLSKIIEPRHSYEGDFDLTNLDCQIRIKLLAKDVNLIVLDSLSGNYLADENSTKFAESVKFLAEIAKLNNIAVLIIHHLRKQSINFNSLSLDRLRGSSKIVQFARSVIGIEKLKNDSIKVSSLKNNLGNKPEPFFLKINNGIMELNDSELVYEKTKVDEAKIFLLTNLKFPMKSSELIDLAKKNGIASATLNRAKNVLNCKSERSCDNGKAFWMTMLPSNNDNQSQVDDNIIIRPP